MYLALCKAIGILAKSTAFWVAVAASLFAGYCVDDGAVGGLVYYLVTVSGVLFAGALAAVAITLGFLSQPLLLEKLDKHPGQKSKVYLDFCEALKDDVYVMLASLSLVVLLVVFEKVDVPYVKYPLEGYSKMRLFLSISSVLFWVQVSAAKDIISSIFKIVEIYYEVSNKPS